MQITAVYVIIKGKEKFGFLQEIRKIKLNYYIFITNSHDSTYLVKSQAKNSLERGISMQQTGYAFFVKRPRVIEDLRKPHLVEQERPFEVVKTVILHAIDYENFVTDMVADRQFIEDSADLCSKGEIWKCILVQRRGSHDGILVLPEGVCYVGYAAYLTDKD